MGKELDKFLKDYKQISKRIDALSPARGEKQKKGMLAHLKKTWAAEDLMQEAVKKARLSGVQGKKSADFVKLGEVSKAMKPWRGALDQHTAGLKQFEAFCDEAKKLEKELSKRLALIEKELKSSGGASDKKTMATIKEAQKAATDLKKSAGLAGTLQGHVVMYGANLQRTIDGVVKTALAAVDPKEFPKAFEKANRPRTARMLKDNPRKIDKLCKLAMKEVEAGRLDKMDKTRKGLQGLLSELEALDKEGQKVLKTMKKEISAAADGKEIAQMIKLAAQSFKKCRAQVDELEDAISQAEEEAGN